MPSRLRVITNSELKTRRRCAREHHLSYELGIRAVREDDESLRDGSLVHLGLEQWWRAPKSSRLTSALAALPPDLDPYVLARLVEMLHGYDVRWGDEPLEAISVNMVTQIDPIDMRLLPLVEAEFRAPLINPGTGNASRTFALGGKLDVLALNHEDGRTYIIEHKTSSDDITSGSPYWQILRLDTQISTYYAGARSMGFEPAGVIYDVLGKPKLRPLQATPLDARKYTKDGRLYAKQRDVDETPQEYQLRVRDAIASEPDRYYVRGTVVRLEQEERDAQWDAWQEARMIREAELAKRWPRNPDGCRRYGRMCTYFDVCTGAASLDDPERFRKVENVHEELTPEDSSHGSDSSRITH